MLQIEREGEMLKAGSKEIAEKVIYFMTIEIDMAPEFSRHILHSVGGQDLPGIMLPEALQGIIPSFVMWLKRSGSSLVSPSL